MPCLSDQKTEGATKLHSMLNFPKVIGVVCVSLGYVCLFGAFESFGLYVSVWAFFVSLGCVCVSLGFVCLFGLCVCLFSLCVSLWAVCVSLGCVSLWAV